ncbi:hypothetical protein GBA52_007990 [Prunus armeniaca]|nr:hypothetical protein GBA52_007990 [Prunus armeniaca]
MSDWFDGLQVLGEVGYQFSAVCASSLITLMESIDEIAQGISNALAISEEEAIEIVSLEDRDSLRAEQFLLVGRLLKPKNDFDRRKVMRGAPCTFDRSLLVLAFTDGSMDPMTVPLEIQNFWVRIRRIPPIFLTPALGEKIGNHIGRFVAVDKEMNGDCLGSFLRVRLQVQAEPQRDPMFSVVRSFGEAFGTFEDEVTPMEEEHETTLKGLHFGGSVSSDPIENEGGVPKSPLVSSSDGQVAMGKRKGVKVGGQCVRGSLPKPGAVESVGVSSVRKTTSSTGKSVMGSGEWAHNEK